MGRWILHESDPLQISFHAGPGFIFRETWRDVPGYRADNVLQESERFLPYFCQTSSPLKRSPAFLPPSPCGVPMRNSGRGGAPRHARDCTIFHPQDVPLSSVPQPIARRQSPPSPHRSAATPRRGAGGEDPHETKKRDVPRRDIPRSTFARPAPGKRVTYPSRPGWWASPMPGLRSPNSPHRTRTPRTPWCNWRA